jgi:hypothetical protein
MSENAYEAEGTNEIRLTLHSGRRIDIRTITPEQIRIEDIAHALSHLCRFAGHVPEFYSVAQHCVMVAHLLPSRDPLLQLQGLLHDASEAYLVDLPHFVKHAPELAGYRALEADLEIKLAHRFGLPFPFDPKVKHADRTACDIEWKQMMRGESISFVAPIKPQTPADARSRFLSTYRRLSFALNRNAITRI